MKIHNAKNNISVRNFINNKNIKLKSKSSQQLKSKSSQQLKYEILDELFKKFIVQQNNIIWNIAALLNNDPYNNGHIIFDDIISGITEHLKSSSEVISDKVAKFNNDFKLYSSARFTDLKNPDNYTELQKLFTDAQTIYNDKIIPDGQLLMNSKIVILQQAKVDYIGDINAKNPVQLALSNYEKDVFNSITEFDKYIDDNNITYIDKILHI